MRYLLVIVVLCAGCQRAPEAVAPEAYRYCEPNTAGRAEWILQCAEAANPKADEEGEDLVKQCEATSEALFCPYVMHQWSGREWRPVQPEKSASSRGTG